METILGFADWLKDRKIYPLARRILSFVFCLTIATFYINKYYPGKEITILPSSDTVYEWLVGGHYFVPVLVVLMVYAFTWMGSSIVIALLGNLIGWALRRKIQNYKIHRNEVDKGMAAVRMVARLFKVRPTKAEMIAFYSEQRQSMSASDLEEIKNGLLDGQKEITANFHAAVRLLLAICVYHASLDYFGKGLFVTSIVLLSIILFLLLLGYLLLDIIPTFAGKFDETAQAYINNHLPAKPEKD